MINQLACTLLTVAGVKHNQAFRATWRVVSSVSHVYLLKYYLPQVFNQKTGSVRKALKSLAEFHYVDAPHEAKLQEAEAAANGPGAGARRAWWTWQVRISEPKNHARSNEGRSWFN